MEQPFSRKTWLFICVVMLTGASVCFYTYYNSPERKPTMKLDQMYTLLVNRLNQYPNEIKLHIRKIFTSSLQKNEIQANDNTSTTPKKVKYAIFYCVGKVGITFCGGWGNRIVGILSTYMLAMATDRTFGIIMTHPCSLTEALVPNNYNWNFSTSMFEKMSSIYLNLQNKKEFTKSLATIDFNAKYPQDVVYINTNQEFLFHLQQNELYKKKVAPKVTGELYGQVFQYLFKLNPSLQKELDSFLGKARPNPETKLLCAQIRIGRNPSVRFDHRATMPKSEVDVVWKFLNETLKESNIFVTTDSEETRQLAKAYYGGKCFDTAGPIMHTDKPYGVKQLCAGLRKLILDQYILMKCDTLLVSISSFIRMPLWIRGTKTSFVFRKGKVEPM